MIDTKLIVEDLRRYGHTVDEVVPLPENAGSYEFMVDGAMLTLAQVNELLETEQSA